MLALSLPSRGVCLSVRLFVGHVAVLYRNGWTYRQTFFSAW